MSWSILDKPRSEQVINAVKSAGLGELFAPSTSEVRVMPLSFYRGTELYRVTNFATLPAFSLFYLCGPDGRFYYLDGSLFPIHVQNKPDNMALTEQTIPPYLDFYFRNVILDVGEIKFPGERDANNILQEFPEDMTTTYHAERALFVVTAPLDYDGTLVRATIEIDMTGSVRITETKMDMHAMRPQQDDTPMDDNAFYE